MASKFLILRTSRATRIFAIIGIVLALWLNAYFPVIGVESFARRIVLGSVQGDLTVEYPRFLIVAAAVDSGDSVAYSGKAGADKSMYLYVGDLDASDVQLRETFTKPHIFLVMDCGRLSNETRRQARVILQAKPFDEVAFRKLPLTSTQRTVLMLQVLGTHLRILGIPAKAEICPGVVTIYFRAIVAYSSDSAS